MMMRVLTIWIAAAVFFTGALPAQNASKPPLDQEAYDTWYSIGSQQISPDGRWLVYILNRTGEDADLRLKDLEQGGERSFPRGGNPGFTEGGTHLIFRARPEWGSGRSREPDAVVALDLTSNEETRFSGIRSFRTAGTGAGWLAYHLNRDAEEERLGVEEPDPDEEERERGNGTLLVIRDLATGEEREYSGVSSYFFAGDGQRLFYQASTGEEEKDGIYTVDLRSGRREAVLTGGGRYRDVTADGAGEQVTFLFEAPEDPDAEAEEAEAEGPVVYHWREGRGTAVAVAAAGDAGLPDGWEVSIHGSLSFSADGSRIFFGTAPAPEPEPEGAEDLVGDVEVDIWHWRDAQIQPVQLRRVNAERRRNFRAVIHLEDGNRIVQLGTPDVPSVSLGDRGNADVALASSSEPYVIENQWERPSLRDLYLLDIRTGEHELLAERKQYGLSFSPGMRYAFWWDREARAWFTMDLADGVVRNISEAVPVPLYNEGYDLPQPPPAYGNAGWTEGDARFLVYCRHDIWELDPAGGSQPRNVTYGTGRAGDLRFRVVRLDRSERYLDPSKRKLLSAFSYATKADGFYRTRLRGDHAPELLVMRDVSYSTPRKAADADVLLYTRSTIGDFPDLWVADLDFSDERRVTQANPQQADYNWATAELVEWRSADGYEMQGILYKPEDFDPSLEYPMITYFYERSSDGLHRYYVPEPHRSAISPLIYASQGYLVFLPDIVYRIGYPGESSLNAIVPGVLHLLERGYVDEDNLGLQGHSWAGYQIAFMATRTNMFRAAAAGAPVGNMISAYGGIRWQTGLSRQFQYERTQSRLGGHLWDMPVRYIENSPIFWVDKIETPMLIMHNDRDGHVPWEQGIELFLALRRLGKPAWLINYNDEPHWPTSEANKRDWQLRLHQFFDHYLKGAPPPVWLAEGVPAVRKGQTLGTELVSPDSAGTGGDAPPDRR